MLVIVLQIQIASMNLKSQVVRYISSRYTYFTSKIFLTTPEIELYLDLAMIDIAT